MLRFKTSFLLKATAVTALGCLPMAFNKESGFIGTAFILPISYAWLAANQIGKHGQYEFKFRKLSDSVVEIYTTGGRQEQWLTRSRIIIAGGCLSVAFGFPALHLVDPEPPEFWLPLVALFAIGAVMLIGYSAKRKILTEERALVVEYFLFDRLCWWRRRWQVREGDFLAVIAIDQTKGEGNTKFRFNHTLYVCRSRRRWMIASGLFTSERVVAGMEIAAQRVAKLVDLPYEGYREPKGFWWPG